MGIVYHEVGVGCEIVISKLPRNHLIWFGRMGGDAASSTDVGEQTTVIDGDDSNSERLAQLTLTMVRRQSLRH